MNIKEEVTKSNNTYTCAICNKKHYSIEDRIACETKCLEERKKAEEVMKKHKLELEKKDRMNKIETMYEDLSNLISSYIEDYGYINIDIMLIVIVYLRYLVCLIFGVCNYEHNSKICKS